VGTYGRVAPRSGLGTSPFPYLYLLLMQMPASKFMIDTGAGVIDADYRGIVFVLLFNHSDSDFKGRVLIQTLL
jgi:dUTP pyrophosphatase